MSLSLAQKVAKVVLPKRFFEEVKRQSKTWLVTCPRCGYELSVWDYGGLRSYAYGTKLVLKRCHSCKRWQLMTVHKAQA